VARTTRLFLVVSLAVLALGRPGAAQHPSYRSSTLLVALQVTVLHGSKLVPGLNAEDLAIFEDGVPQRLEFFDARKVGLDLTLLLDTSSSMGVRFQPIHENAVEFMKALRPGDRGAVVAFNDAFNVVQPLTEDREHLASAIRSTRASGSTSLRNALYIALKQVERMRPEPEALRRQAIVALSDGRDTASLVNFEDVLTLAQNSGVNLYIVTVRPPRYGDISAERDPEGEFDLRTLARSTGAEAFFLNDAKSLKSTLDVIAGELVTKYSLAYVPTDTAADERFRHIEVRVTTNPAYRARARAGYVAHPAVSAMNR
jgi:Ca-activated chloride channel family protein